MHNAKIDDYAGSNNRVFSNYDRDTGLEFLPLEKFKQGGKLNNNKNKKAHLIPR